MSTSKKTEKKTTPSKKKVAREAVSEQLSSSLNELKETLGEKKFLRRIKKAARLLTAGIKTKPVKKEKKVKGKTKINKANKTKKAVTAKAVTE